MEFLGHEESSLSLLMPIRPSTLQSSVKEPRAGSRLSNLASFLEQISRKFIAVFNARAWSSNNAIHRLSENFTAQLDGATAATGWTRFASLQHEAVKDNPGYQIHILDVSVQVDDSARYATVFMLVEITGMPDDVRREDVFVMEWKKIKGRWEWVRHTSMRGTPGLRLADSYQDD